MIREKIEIDIDWLLDLYLRQFVSVKKIANMIGCCEETVRRYLIRMGIKRRQPRETFLGNRKDDGFHLDNVSIFNGSLLGDASIVLGRGKILTTFRKTNKNYDHVLYVARKIFTRDVEARIYKRNRTRKGTPTVCYELWSLGHEELISLYGDWYHHVDGVVTKRVPDYLKLDKDTILHWFLDDGCCSCAIRKGLAVLGRCNIVFCSESFTEDENVFLCEQMKHLGLGAYVQRANRGLGWRVAISQAYAKDFFEFIGDCPDEISSMQYKWKMRS